MGITPEQFSKGHKSAQLPRIRSGNTKRARGQKRARTLNILCAHSIRHANYFPLYPNEGVIGGRRVVGGRCSRRQQVTK
eukprot:6183832-Pleurochrysis_carterae.AAC.1